MGSADELVDVVDEHDVVTAVVTRSEMRSQRLRHRTVFIAVTNPSGDVLVHRRADHKDVWSGRWDLAAGGVERGEARQHQAGQHVRGAQLGHAQRGQEVPGAGVRALGEQLVEGARG